MLNLSFLSTTSNLVLIIWEVCKKMKPTSDPLLRSKPLKFVWNGRQQMVLKARKVWKNLGEKFAHNVTHLCFCRARRMPAGQSNMTDYVNHMDQKAKPTKQVNKNSYAHKKAQLQSFTDHKIIFKHNISEHMRPLIHHLIHRQSKYCYLRANVFITFNFLSLALPVCFERLLITASNSTVVKCWGFNLRLKLFTSAMLQGYLCLLLHHFKLVIYNVWKKQEVQHLYSTPCIILVLISALM